MSIDLFTAEQPHKAGAEVLLGLQQAALQASEEAFFGRALLLLRSGRRYRFKQLFFFRLGFWFDDWLRFNDRLGLNDRLRLNNRLWLNNRLRLDDRLRFDDRLWLNDRFRFDNRLRFNNWLWLNDRLRFNNWLWLNDRLRFDDRFGLNDWLWLNDRLRFDNRLWLGDRLLLRHYLLGHADNLFGQRLRRWVFGRRRQVLRDLFAGLTVIPLSRGVDGGGRFRFLGGELVIQLGDSRFSRRLRGLRLRLLYRLLRLLLLFFLFLLAKAQPGEKPTFLIFCHVMTLLRTEGSLTLHT